MKREIKFRGKSITTGDWIYGMTISKGTIKRKRDNIFFETDEGKWVGVDSDTVGQFTGLKDINGVEVYEDDIVNIFSGEFHDSFYEIQEKCIVKFINGSFFLVCPDKCSYVFGEIDVLDKMGNIHEHIHLLL